MTAPLALDATQLKSLAARLPLWSVSQEVLIRTWHFASFEDAMTFMQDAAVEIKRLNHHPEWTNIYDRVSCKLRTHDAGDRVTAKDAELAAILDWIANRFAA